MKRLAIAAVLALAGCGMQTQTIEGEFVLHDEEGFDSRTCSGTGGYSDIRQGMNVTVSDEEGTILATANFSEGFRLNDTECRFTFTLDEVPRADFYSIEAGRRGELTYSYDEMVAADWSVALEIGR